MRQNKYLLILVVSVCSACYYDVKEELQPTTYVEDIAPIIQSNCYSCHNINNPRGGISYESFEDVVFSIEKGTFTECIEYQEGYFPMPPSQPLSTTQLQQIKTWIKINKPYE